MHCKQMIQHRESLMHQLPQGMQDRFSDVSRKADMSAGSRPDALDVRGGRHFGPIFGKALVEVCSSSRRAGS